MNHLEQNIKGLCAKHGIHFNDFLADLEVDEVHELTLYDLQAIAEEYQIDLLALLFKPVYNSDLLTKKLRKIECLIVDVDGVMTDGGMYWSEQGDQIKKFNTKDGLGLLELTKKAFKVGIISSGFTQVMVQKRAELLGITHCYVGQQPKLEVLETWCKEWGISLENVAVIGDDKNDLALMKAVGFAACPSDAVNEIKSICNLILERKGGEGCVREFIDAYLNQYIK
ncbi:MAG: KdsC family phosphatase [Flavobacteriales bacterium]|jgi:YrbI family 3-deoxy-D-manno-octulosonate 8-phosphate phosphatase